MTNNCKKKEKSTHICVFFFSFAEKSGILMLNVRE